MTYLSETVNPVAEEIYVASGLRYRCQRILIHQFNSFYMGKIYIYSAAMFPKICVQIRSYSWKTKEKIQKWVFLFRHSVEC